MRRDVLRFVGAHRADLLAKAIAHNGRVAFVRFADKQLRDFRIEPIGLSAPGVVGDRLGHKRQQLGAIGNLSCFHGKLGILGPGPGARVARRGGIIIPTVPRIELEPLAAHDADLAGQIRGLAGRFVHQSAPEEFSAGKAVKPLPLGRRLRFAAADFHRPTLGMFHRDPSPSIAAGVRIPHRRARR